MELSKISKTYKREFYKGQKNIQSFLKIKEFEEQILG